MFGFNLVNVCDPQTRWKYTKMSSLSRASYWPYEATYFLIWSKICSFYYVEFRKPIKRKPENKNWNVYIYDDEVRSSKSNRPLQCFRKWSNWSLISFRVITMEDWHGMISFRYMTSEVMKRERWKFQCNRTFRDTYIGVTDFQVQAWWHLV